MVVNSDEDPDYIPNDQNLMTEEEISEINKLET